MGKHPTKAANNVYCQARMKAAEFNPMCRSREAAAEFLNISRDSIAEYELDLCKVVPVDKVIIMADGYNAPELLNYYCSHECPIGRDMPTEVRPIELVTLKLINTLENSEIMRKSLLNIAEDGVISGDEKVKFDEIMKYFEKVEKTIHELKLISDSCMKGE